MAPPGRPEPVATRKKKKSGPKVHIEFDAEKRKEYLTGFSKRKQARRRFGLDMEAFKQRKKQLEMKKEQKRDLDERIKKALDTDENIDTILGKEKTENEEERKATEIEKTKYTDDFTQNQFGQGVIVTTTLGIPESDEDDDQDGLFEEEMKELAAARKAKQQQQQPQLTLFQRVQLKRKGKALPTRRNKMKQVKQATQFFTKQGGKKGSNRKTKSKKSE